MTIVETDDFAVEVPAGWNRTAVQGSGTVVFRAESGSGQLTINAKRLKSGLSNDDLVRTVEEIMNARLVAERALGAPRIDGPSYENADGAAWSTYTAFDKVKGRKVVCHVIAEDGYVGQVYLECAGAKDAEFNDLANMVLKSIRFAVN